MPSVNPQYAAGSINLIRLPVSATTLDGNGVQYAATVWRYDETPLQDAPGAVGHDGGYGTGFLARGNVTSVGAWLNTTNTYLTTTKAYDSAGNVVGEFDPNNHGTRFNYNDDGSNQYALATSRPQLRPIPEIK